MSIMLPLYVILASGSGMLLFFLTRALRILSLVSDADGNLDSNSDAAMEKVHMIAAMLMAASSSGPFSSESSPPASRVRFDQGTTTQFTSGTAWRTSRFHASNVNAAPSTPAVSVADISIRTDMPITPPPSTPTTSTRFPFEVYSAPPLSGHGLRPNHTYDEQVDLPIIFRHTPPIDEEERVPTSTTSFYPSPSASPPAFRLSAPTFRLHQLSSPTPTLTTTSNSNSIATTSSGSSPSSSAHSLSSSSWYLWTQNSGGSRGTQDATLSLSSSNTSLNSLDRLDGGSGGKYGVIGDSSPMNKSAADAMHHPQSDSMVVPLHYANNNSPYPSDMWPSNVDNSFSFAR